ncbi:hypothetical protein BRC83_05370 [Halobacteriales archaeon QS_1_68_17]|nr:MAG: hypothetical protein BRC83_05370 [Halobacteriales archaeon QS_1_68_17]
MTEYTTEAVRRRIEDYPEVFGDEFRVIEVPDRLAAARGRHATGETIFVARVVEETPDYLDVEDVYRVTLRNDAELYFVAKHWADGRLPRDAVSVVG